MADINISAPYRSRAPAAQADQAPHPAEPIWDLIELLFFAYRDFVGDPDDVLAKFGFGRAHHRVLHFVNRNPGMKVADLLDILKHHQAVARPRAQAAGRPGLCRAEGRRAAIAASACSTSRRRARRSRMKLAGLQTERIARALGRARPGRARGRAPLPDRDDRRRRPRRRAAADRARRPRTAAAHLIREGNDGRQPADPPADDAPHLLVVDDDRRIRDLLSRFLPARAIASPPPTTPRDARAKLDGLRFDLLILDVMMPGETGFELAQVDPRRPRACRS